MFQLVGVKCGTLINKSEVLSLDLGFYTDQPRCIELGGQCLEVLTANQRACDLSYPKGSKWSKSRSELVGISK